MKKLCTLFLTFLKIGAFTFGGGYAMVALLENEFIAKKKWIDKKEFLDMIAIAESHCRCARRGDGHAWGVYPFVCHHLPHFPIL